MKLHSVAGDFPARVAQRAACRALFIERGVRVVEMNQDTAHVAGVLQLFEETIRAGERHVADFAGGLAAAANVDQLVVGPERAVEKREITPGRATFPIVYGTGKARRLPWQDASCCFMI